MKHYYNIEKHTGLLGYVGYTGDGFGRFIEKSRIRAGLWVAYPHLGEGHKAVSLYAKNLDDMSAALASIKAPT